MRGILGLHSWAVLLAVFTISSFTYGAVDKDVYEFVMGKKVLVENVDGMEVTGVLVGSKNGKIFVKKDNGTIVTLQWNKVESIKELKDTAAQKAPTPGAETEPPPPRTEAKPSPPPRTEAKATPPQHGITVAQKPMPDAQPADTAGAQSISDPAPLEVSSRAESHSGYQPPTGEKWSSVALYNLNWVETQLEDPALDPAQKEEYLGLQKSLKSSKKLVSRGKLMWLLGTGMGAVGTIFIVVNVAGGFTERNASIGMWVFAWTLVGVAIPLVGIGLPLHLIGKKRAMGTNEKLKKMETRDLAIVPLIDITTGSGGIGLRMRF